MSIHTVEIEWEVNRSGVLECRLDTDRVDTSTKSLERILEKGKNAGGICGLKETDNCSKMLEATNNAGHI